jgi:hypothetical protein
MWSSARRAKSVSVRKLPRKLGEDPCMSPVPRSLAPPVRTPRSHPSTPPSTGDWLWKWSRVHDCFVPKVQPKKAAGDTSESSLRRNARSGFKFGCFVLNRKRRRRPEKAALAKLCQGWRAAWQSFAKPPAALGKTLPAFVSAAGSARHWPRNRRVVNNLLPRPSVVFSRTPGPWLSSGSWPAVLPCGVARTTGTQTQEKKRLLPATRRRKRPAAGLATMWSTLCLIVRPF